jgi:hypothetical protein
LSGRSVGCNGGEMTTENNDDAYLHFTYLREKLFTACIGLPKNVGINS